MNFYWKGCLVLYLFLIFSWELKAQLFDEVYSQRENDTSTSQSWVDYDNDGDLDIVFALEIEYNRVVINNGDLTFEELPLGELPFDPEEGRDWLGSRVSWIDYDNDGDSDLFLFQGAKSYQYEVSGDSLIFLYPTEINEIDVGTPDFYAWGDYDSDGFVDVYIVGSGGLLLKNNGDGSFESVEQGDLFPSLVETFGFEYVNWIDYDLDGDQDFFGTVWNGGPDRNIDQNMLFKNDGQRNYTEVINDLTAPLGPGYNQPNVKATWGDFDNDGDFDVVLTGPDSLRYYEYLGDDTFGRVLTNEIAAALPVRNISSGDHNNDGFLDLFVISHVVTGFTEESTLHIYENNGDGSFELIVEHLTATLDMDGHINAMGWGDLDRDGDLDLGLSTNIAPRNTLHVNNNSTGNNWIILQLKGVLSNAPAIGATVMIVTGSHKQLRSLQTVNGSQAENLEVHFGLGQATVIDSLNITWPSGIKQTLIDVAPNQVLEVTEDLSLVTALKEPGPAPLKIFPNPTKSRLNVELTKPIREGHIVIYNIMGVAVIRINLKSESLVQLDLSTLADGVYLLKYEGAEQGHVEKLIIHH